MIMDCVDSEEGFDNPTTIVTLECANTSESNSDSEEKNTSKSDSESNTENDTESDIDNEQ